MPKVLGIDLGECLEGVRRSEAPETWLDRLRRIDELSRRLERVQRGGGAE